ncbi:hypothetical protein CVT24_005766 [Panaeolus cyanescens]|uniref:NAD(P)-binding protein n=1 Tax=Panaeolus cyanescens TaxID=181874 RepID=A0A409YF60_9AGAR|nr:hypothetical protein CVT24_005766 [Panaeolus cyanescens]
MSTTGTSIDKAQCILITGATAGIGRALAIALSELPSKPRIIAAGRRKDRLEELAKRGFETFEFSIGRDTQAVKKQTLELIERYPELDAVILNAGIQHEIAFKKDAVDQTIEKMVDEMSVNYLSVVTMITAVLPHFLKLSEQDRPSFVIPVTSGLGVIPGPWVPNYSASKAALHSFSVSLGIQLEHTNVNVLEIIPPLVESELHDAYGTSEALAKFWMPLDEYIQVTVEGLRKGNKFISSGLSQVGFEKFDLPKLPFIDAAKCILVTGATSGIGRGLAIALSKLPGKPRVIAAGRRKERLAELASQGIETVEFSIDNDAQSVKDKTLALVERFPELDAIILNAGIQHEVDFKSNEVDQNVEKLVDEISINYISVVTMISAVLPHFLRLSEQNQPSFVIPVTSGLAVFPAAWIPNYCASKAALHSFTLSLGLQLQETNVNVLEIIPPLVESELHDRYGTTAKYSKFWMPLDAYIENTVEGLRKGDQFIACGRSKESFEKFEAPKVPLAVGLVKARETWK